MIIILNNGSIVNFSHISMINRDVRCNDFGRCRCNIHTLTLYSDGLPKCIIAEEANGYIVGNVLEEIKDAVISGKPIVDFREMGLTDGDKLYELKNELEQAYRKLEECPRIYVKQTDAIVQNIHDKKDAIVKLFRMPIEKAEEFMKSDALVGSDGSIDIRLRKVANENGKYNSKD